MVSRGSKVIGTVARRLLDARNSATWAMPRREESVEKELKRSGNASVRLDEHAKAGCVFCDISIETKEALG
jgi:hypothetical protein